jgi:hypothetical protein
MATQRHLRAFLQCVRRTVGSDTGLCDAELLRRFVARRDEAAFELMVWRHGAMVYNVCHRVLGEAYATEDAFQATFLILTLKGAVHPTAGRPGELAAPGGLPGGPTGASAVRPEAARVPARVGVPRGHGRGVDGVVGRTRPVGAVLPVHVIDDQDPQPFLPAKEGEVQARRRHPH